jgi:hypothetical protein
MTNGLWLWLLAGPNGAGKSTRAPDMSSYVEEIVTPDAVTHAPVKSARLAIARMMSLLRERRSFAVETTLSGRLHLNMAARAKATGWKVGLFISDCARRNSPSSALASGALGAAIIYRSLTFADVMQEVLRIWRSFTESPTVSSYSTILPHGYR